MTVAARSSSECAASDRIASEPVASPTTPLASVSPPEAAIDVSATRCLMSCMARLGDERRSGRGSGRQLAPIPGLLFQIDADGAKELLNQYFDKVQLKQSSDSLSRSLSLT